MKQLLLNRSFLRFAFMIACQVAIHSSVLAQCQASFTAIPDSTGNGVQFISTSTGTNANTNYLWSFGDTTYGTSANEHHFYANSGWYWVCLTIFDSAGCQSTSCDTVLAGNISSGCNASFTVQTSNLTAFFTNHSTGTGLTYAWSFGDGAVSSQQNPSHTYALAGPYNVCLVISNGTCADTTCIWVQVVQQPNCHALFQSYDSSGVFYFFNTSTGTTVNTSYTWSFGDGTFGYNEHEQHAYTVAGWYNVCLTISDSLTSCTSTTCDSVYNSGGLACNAIWNWQAGGATAYFYNYSVGSNLTYLWDFGDGSTSTQMHPNHTYAVTGYYTVCLTVTNGTCTDSTCQQVHVVVGTTCQAMFTSTPDSTGGFYFSSTSTGTNATTVYQWTYGDGGTGSGPNVYHHYTSPGYINPCLTIIVYDSLQNIICQDQVCDSIYNPGGNNCSAMWTSQSNQLQAFFADMSTATDPIISWLWDFGDGNGSVQQSPYYTYSQPGYYYVCLTIATASCTDNYCHYVHITTAPPSTCQANFTMYPDSSGMGFYFQDLSTGTNSSTNYQWYFGDGGSSSLANPHHLYPSAGYYTVCLTIYDSVCQSTLCDTLYVGQSSTCNPYFVWSPDSTGNGVQYYQFNSNSPFIQYTWVFGDWDTSFSANPYHVYASPGAWNTCLYVTQTDSVGNVICMGSYCDSVFVGGVSCTPQITAMPDSSGWGNGTVNFSVTSACGTITSATWTFGDGGTGTGSSETHQYGATGWYLVCVDIVVNGITFQACDSVFAYRMVGVEEAEGQIRMLIAYPNPATSTLNVTFGLTRTSDFTLRLFDASGKVVRWNTFSNQSAGRYNLQFNVSDIARGIYLIVIQTNESTVSRRIQVQ